jgi:MATE family multidrug resistance protein
VSLGVSIWFIINITLMGVLMSISPTVAHHVGAQEFDAVPHVVRQGLWKALMVGLVAMVFANLAALIFDHIKLEPEVRALAQGFIRITSLGLPAFAAFRVLYGYSTSLGQSRPLMVIALCALLLHGFFNWLLIYGHWGFAPMGGLGCAWSALICVWFNLFAMLWWMKRSPPYRQTWPFDRFEAPHWPQLRVLFKLGLPIGVTYFAEASAFSLIALLVAEFGSAQVAAHQIALNFASLTFMVPMSMGVAILTRVGQSLGARDPVTARFRAWVGIATALVFAAVAALLMALFNQQIAQAYTNDAQVAALAADLLMLAAIFQLSDACQVATSSAIRGYKVTRAPMVIHLTAFWLVSLPLGYALGLAPPWLPWVPAHPMAAQGFWIALVVSLTLAAASLVLLLRRIALGRMAEHLHR